MRKNKKDSDSKSLAEIKTKYFGKKGSSRRDSLEDGYTLFKMGHLIKEARLEKGLTQEELADRVGTTKSYISKIENNVKEARISTLQRVVEDGFGGVLEVSIKL